MLSSLFAAVAVAAVLVTSSVAPSLATVPSFMNQENSISGQSAESRKLDETALRKNALERLKKAIKDQEPDAKGLERLTIENMIVQKSIPIKAGDLDLYLVKVQFKNPEAESEDNYGNVELVMLVDHTGTFQLPDVFRISDGASQTAEEKRIMYTVEHKDGLGDLVAKGDGPHNVIFISDNFCPYCKQAYSFFLQNLKRIAELRIVHLPMPSLHPTATIASAVMSYAKDIMAPDRFFDLVTFAYNALEPGERILKGTGRNENTPITPDELKEMELDVVNQYVAKFPELGKERDVKSLYDHVKKNFGKKREKEAAEVSRQMKVSGTPATLSNGYLIRGFNRVELQKTLEAEPAPAAK